MAITKLEVFILPRNSIAHSIQTSPPLTQNVHNSHIQRSTNTQSHSALTTPSNNMETSENTLEAPLRLTTAICQATFLFIFEDIYSSFANNDLVILTSHEKE